MLYVTLEVLNTINKYLYSSLLDWLAESTYLLLLHLYDPAGIRDCTCFVLIKERKVPQSRSAFSSSQILPTGRLNHVFLNLDHHCDHQFTLGVSVFSSIMVLEIGQFSCIIYHFHSAIFVRDSFDGD